MKSFKLRSRVSIDVTRALLECPVMVAGDSVVEDGSISTGSCELLGSGEPCFAGEVGHNVDCKGCKGISCWEILPGIVSLGEVTIGAAPEADGAA